MTTMKNVKIVYQKVVDGYVIKDYPRIECVYHNTNMQDGWEEMSIDMNEKFRRDYFPADIREV